MADRYTYLAYFGLFVLSASLTETYLMVYLKRYKIILFFILLIVLSIYTYNRCMVWKNTKTLFSDVINKNPKVSFAYLNLATIYLNQQNIDSAMFCYNNSIKFDSIEPTAYFNRAFAFDMIGKNDKAINDFNKALKLDKKNIYKALIYTYIGESYRKSGNNTFAIKYYNLSLKEDSLLALAYDNRGTYFLNNNMLDNAKKDFLKAIEIDKFNFSALNNFGWVLTLQGKYIEALEYYNKSLNINSNYAFAYNNRGYTEFYMGNITFAIFDYNKAIQLNPYFTQAYLNRGWAYASLKNYKGAIDDFTFVLKIEKNNQLARNNRAYAYFYTNDYKSAAEDFKTNVDNFPNSALSWQNIAWYHLQVKDYENSISEFNKSIELDNTLINSYINIGWIWLEKNNYKNSENYFKKALVINPQNIDALYFLGEVYRKSNKNDLACDYYNKSSELGNNQAKQAIEKYCKK